MMIHPDVSNCLLSLLCLERLKTELMQLILDTQAHATCWVLYHSQANDVQRNPSHHFNNIMIQLYFLNISTDPSNSAFQYQGLLNKVASILTSHTHLLSKHALQVVSFFLS